MITSGNPQGTPNVHRTVAGATNLKAVSGVPNRCAAFVVFTNGHATNAETAVFTGPDGVNVTVTLSAMSMSPPFAEVSTLGTLGADVTCVAGWIDDGSVPLNG
jgi:hypothetical protein